MPYWYVNVDVAFLVNFLTDLAWLWATARLAGVQAGKWRLALGAGVGAAAAVWAYFPTGRWLTSGPGILAGTAGMLALAFLPCRGRQATRAAAYFILSGGAMAGMILMAANWTGGPGFSPGLVAAGLLVGVVGLRYLWEAARDRSRVVGGLYGLRIRLAGETVTLPALLDTGNHLRDPLGGRPVAVVEARCLKGVLPREVVGAVGGGWAALERLPGDWAARCRLVPYRAVGQPDGMLLAVVPDEVALQAPGSERWERAVGLIGLAGGPLHAEGRYAALLPEQWLADRAGE